MTKDGKTQRERETIIRQPDVLEKIGERADRGCGRKGGEIEKARKLMD